MCVEQLLCWLSPWAVVLAGQLVHQLGATWLQAHMHHGILCHHSEYSEFMITTVVITHWQWVPESISKNYSVCYGPLAGAYRLPS